MIRSAAAALWATLEKFPLEKSGKFAARLEESLHAATVFIVWLRIWVFGALNLN